MLVFGVFLGVFAIVRGGPATEASYKGQFCTDPRTMRKHAAYTEWADAYSCTRHRCQPGGRNLAIYTVGCKRVEAPESAIECEEVVEDTNMQFPYCCTRLRCLVVVRGEVWTRVLGQPWETLPAAPWSHMYKMKKPPPGDGPVSANKSPGVAPELFHGTGEGPVYELQTETTNEQDRVLRAKKAGPPGTEAPDCGGNEAVARAAPVPDIVIALSTNSDKEGPLPPRKKSEGQSRHKRGRKNIMGGSSYNYFEEDAAIEPRERAIDDLDEATPPSDGEKEKPAEPASEEHVLANTEVQTVTQKPPPKPFHYQQVSWTEIPTTQWNEHEPPVEPEGQTPREPQPYHQPEFPPQEEKKIDKKPGNLQALVDAIGTRMRDIENVVQRMSEKVHQGKPTPASGDQELGSVERRNFRAQDDALREAVREAGYELPKHHEGKPKMKKPNPEGEHYKRFTNKNKGSKYLHTAASDGTTEQPLFIEDTNMNGYFSDASNNLLRRTPPKEPAPTYMAPVAESRRKAPQASEESEKKHKKRAHKKKRTKGHHKKHHVKEDKRKRFNRLNSVELERNGNSMEDSSGIASK